MGGVDCRGIFARADSMAPRSLRWPGCVLEKLSFPVFFLACGSVVAVAASSTGRAGGSGDVDLLDEWKKCTALCRAAGKHRVAFKNTEESFSMECLWDRRRDGVLRILESTGVGLLAYQPCALWRGGERSQYPLSISRLRTNVYQLSFRHRLKGGKSVKAEVALTASA